MAACLTINRASIPGIELAVFDKDGTLICVHTYWQKMIDLRATLICDRLDLNSDNKLGLMDHMGVNVNTGRIKEEGPVGIKSRRVVLQAGLDYLKSIGIGSTGKMVNDCFLEADNISSRRLGDFILPLDGLNNLMNSLRAKNVKIAIATTDLSSRASMAFCHLGLEKKIDMIVGADMVESAKPFPEMLNLIIDKLGTRPENAVMVGDAETDLQMGLNAGFKASIGVTSGLTSLVNLQKITSFVIPGIADIEIC